MILKVELFEHALYVHSSVWETKFRPPPPHQIKKNKIYITWYLFIIKCHFKLKEEALYNTVCRSGFGRGYGPVVRQTTEGLKCYKIFLERNKCLYCARNEVIMPLIW